MEEGQPDGSAGQAQRSLHPLQTRQQAASTSGRLEPSGLRSPAPYGIGGPGQAGYMHDLPPTGHYGPRTSLPAASMSGREQQPPPLRKQMSSIGGPSIGSSASLGGPAPGPAGLAGMGSGLTSSNSNASSSSSIGGGGSGSVPSQWGWNPTLLPQRRQEQQIGSYGGPGQQQGTSIGGAPLSRTSTNIGMIGARQPAGTSYSGYGGQAGYPTQYGQQPHSGHLIGAQPPAKGHGLQGLQMPSASHMPTPAQGSISTGPTMGSQPHMAAPSLGQGKFSLGRGPYPSTLNDSVTSLNLSQGSSASSAKPAHPPTPSPPAAKVKVICNSGGHFVRLPSAAFEYQGGEIRLVSVRSGCSHKELLSALDRVMAYPRRSGSLEQEGGPQLRFQLPNEKNTYVDLVDDEDVQLMFDEWHDYVSSTGAAGNAKLQVFVDWQHSTPRAAGSPAAKGKHEDISASDDGSVQMTSQGQVTTAGPLAKAAIVVSDRLEIISPHDVSLVKFLGSGGYGEVYLGKWHSSEAAIKCLNASLFYPGGDGSQKPNHAAMAELLREAEIMARLRHPNVVLVYGVVLPPPENSLDDDDGLGLDVEGPIQIGAAVAQKPNVGGGVRAPAIVTEFLSQGSLRGVLARKSDILTGALVRVLIAMDAAKGMEYLHSKKIVHFDLKSANLLLGHRDRRTICKVADFGLSKQKFDTYVSGVSSQRGTLPWIAPEIIKSPHAVNELVDVYSFGVVLWELWTGREPYEGLNYHALLHQITTLSSVRPPVPGSAEWEQLGDPSPPEPAQGYCELVQSCWHELPQKRPSFTAIVSSLKRMANDLRPQRRASAPGGDVQPAKAVAVAPQVFAPHAQPSSEPSSPNAPAAAGFVQPPGQPR